MTLFKKRFHPCGGFFLEGAIKWIFPINMIMILIGELMLIYDVYSLWDKWMDERVNIPRDFYFRLSLWISYIIHQLIAVPSDFLLRFATQSKNSIHLRIWIVLNFLNAIFASGVYWVHTSYFGIHFPSLVPYNFYCIYRFYTCIVVYYFSIEIEEEKDLQKASRQLTDQEIDEFEDGLDYSGMDLSLKTLIEKVEYEKYKRDEFEISDGLEIDLDNPLGSGQYGIVYRGTYRNAPVAIKTYQPSFLDAVCFKALLSELKIMTYVGRHENIVNLVGAVTSEIKERKLQIIVEFCEFGSLLEYLRASRGLFISFVKEGELLPAKTTEEGSISTFDLIKWARQVANGMCFLEEKKVVHGDLAARNILLTQNGIKIGDFGLARQLYQYSTYVKRQNAPLPWRWMALESLTDMNFSSKSDVWAFSIFLYELFTLAQVPYKALAFNFDFVDNLRKGMRLEQPPNSPNIIYELMTKCWQENSNSRPSFSTILDFFYNLCLSFHIE